MPSSRRTTAAVLLLAVAGTAILAASLLRRREGTAPTEERRPPAWFECEAAALLDQDYYHVLRRVLPRARESIEILQYLWEWTGESSDAPHRLLDDLIAAAARGVRVRVLLEDRVADESRLTGDHREVLRYLRAHGVDARLDDPRRELHDKLVVVDGGETVIVASHSHSRSALLFNHEVGAVVVPADRAAAAPLLAYVEEAFAEGRDLSVPLAPPAVGGAAPMPTGPDSTVFVPARARWVVAADYGPTARALAAHARASVSIGMYYLVPTALVRGHPVDDLLVELRRASGRGVSIEAVLDEEVQGVGRGANDLGRDLLERLGAVVRFDDPGTVSHGKFMVVDERYALLGSHNWSASAFRENRETSVLLEAPSIAEALRRYLRETLTRPGPGAPPPPLSPGEKIDVNTAGRRDLMRLPGIAEGLADAILADRAARGPFRSVSDLRRVDGIGPERYRLVAPHVTASH